MLQSKDNMVDWIKKNNNTHTKTQEPTICCLQETHFRGKDTHRFKVRGWKDISCK